MKTQHSRRDFLKISAAGAFGAFILPADSIRTASESAAVPFQKKDNIGLQLYTIREEMKRDPEASLKRVSEIGYKNLELADYDNGKFYGFAPEEFKKIINDLGMEAISSHAGLPATGDKTDNAKKIAEDHKKLGAQYCIQPFVDEKSRKTIADWQRMVEDWNQAGKIMKDYGLKFGYHNHNFEFGTVEGKVPYYDVILAGLDKNLVIMELDLFWATKAGQDPVEIFKKYPGRFELFHMKDMYNKQAPAFDTGVTYDFAPVGDGIIDFKRILAEKESGVKYLIVEQDRTKDNKPFEAIQTSITNLKTKILA